MDYVGGKYLTDDGDGECSPGRLITSAIFHVPRFISRRGHQCRACAIQFTIFCVTIAMSELHVNCIGRRSKDKRATIGASDRSQARGPRSAHPIAPIRVLSFVSYPSYPILRVLYYPITSCRILSYYIATYLY